MSKTEFKERHLADERQIKPPHSYGKSWGKFKDVTTKSEPVGRDFYNVDEGVEEPHFHHQRNRSASGSSDNIHIIIRKKRATVPMKVDW